MQTTVRTSQLIKERTEQVPARVEKMKEAILTKNFEVFAEETMKVRWDVSLFTKRENLKLVQIESICRRQNKCD